MPGRVVVNSLSGISRLTTLETAKLRLKIAGTAQDSDVALLIARATAAISAHCARPAGFGRMQIAESFYTLPAWNRRDPAPLILSHNPAEVLTVYAAGVLLADGLTDGAPAEWEQDGAPGLVYRMSGGYRTPWATVRPVVVTYNAGYTMPEEDTPNLPAEVENTCLDMIAAAYAAGERDTAVSVDRVEGVGETRYFDRGMTTMQVDDAARIALAGHVARGF